MTLQNNQRFLLRIAREATTVIGRELRKARKKRPLGVELSQIGKGGDVTKQGDALAEQVIKSYFLHCVNTGMLDVVVLVSEESGIKEFRRRKLTHSAAAKSIFAVLDPIDGSNNMRPWQTPRAFLGTSLALGRLESLDKFPGFSPVEVAWIKNILYDLDYYAIAGQGAFFKTAEQSRPLKLQTSPLRNIEQALIAVALDNSGKKFKNLWQRVELLMTQKLCQRRLGSTVLDICSVASGECDAFVSMSGNVKIHDIAAAQLIVKEAGGFMSLKQVRGRVERYFLKSLITKKSEDMIQGVGFEVIAAGNKKLLKNISKVVE